MSYRVPNLIIHILLLQFGGKMIKKTITLLLAFVLCVSVLLAATSCSKEHPIEAFKNKMETTDSYQMSMTRSDVPVFGTFTMTTKVDGNIEYTPAGLLSEEEFIETVGDVAYKYTKKWQRQMDKDNTHRRKRHHCCYRRQNHGTAL